MNSETKRKSSKEMEVREGCKSNEMVVVAVGCPDPGSRIHEDSYLTTSRHEVKSNTLITTFISTSLICKLISNNFIPHVFLSSPESLPFQLLSLTPNLSGNPLFQFQMLITWLTISLFVPHFLSLSFSLPLAFSSVLSSVYNVCQSFHF